MLILHTLNKIPVNKQQEKVLNHPQIFRIAVDFSGEPRKVVANKVVHALNGVRMRFSDEMFCWVDNFVGMPMV